MREDLEKLEAYLKEKLSVLRKADYGYDLTDIFTSSTMSVFPELPSQDVAFLRKLFLPELGGTMSDIQRHWPAFSLCLYYDKVDVFWEEVSKGNIPTKGYEWHALCERVLGFKKEPLDESALAQRILAGHVLYDMMPGGNNAKVKSRVAADFARGTGTPAEETEKFFTTPRAGLDFSVVMNVTPNGGDYLPEYSMSSFMAFARVNPKKHLVAANLEGQIFADDGTFFEGANLRFASLYRTMFGRKTSTDGMLLEGAIMTELDEGWLSGDVLTEDKLARTYIDRTTILPKGFDYERVMEKHKALGLPPAPPITEFEWAHRNLQRQKLNGRFRPEPV